MSHPFDPEIAEDQRRGGLLLNPSAARLYEWPSPTKGPRSCPAEQVATFSSGNRGGAQRQANRPAPSKRTSCLVGSGQYSDRARRLTSACRLGHSTTFKNQPRVFVVDAFAGWDPTSRIEGAVLCSRAYHALFMRNLLIRPTPDELKISVPRLPHHQRRPPRGRPIDSGPPCKTGSCSISIDARWSSWAPAMRRNEKRGLHVHERRDAPRHVLSMHSSQQRRARRRHSLLRPLGNRQDDPLVRPSPPPDRR